MADVSELSEANLDAVLRKIAPRSRCNSIELMPGSFSNITHVVNLTSDRGTASRIVVRRYNPENGNMSAKAHREFAVLHLLFTQGLPVPHPLLADYHGQWLGTPGIVTNFVEGQQVMNPANPEQWARQLAQMLARIHALDCDPAKIPSLMNANTEAIWFLRDKEILKSMSEHPDGQSIWDELTARHLYLRPVRPALIHLDYWVHNILWQDDQISAVLDWEEAAYGDPAVDVAYAHMGFYGMCRSDLADIFLAEYEQAVGKPVANLGFWELAAAVRNMPDPAQWLDEEVALGGVARDATTVCECFRTFIREARQRLTS